MNSRYPLVEMGQFLHLRKQFFVIDDAEEYRLVTVQLHGRGIRERQVLRGAEIKTKRQQRIQSGDLLVAEIDAKVGGYGIVPGDLAGAIVSSHYFLYEIDTNEVDLRYLEYYLKTEQPEQDVQHFVKGSVNYAAIRSQHLPQLRIPLPPIDEQRRIIARIEALSGRIAEAERLQDAALKESEALLASMFDAAFSVSGQTWGVSALPEVSEINPSRKGLAALPDDSPVTFVPMAAVDGETGTIRTPEVRLFGEVKRGYTLFQLGDVIWAKITPCMQNGKSAVVNHLLGPVGFGSTEFHVIRPGHRVTSDWVHRFVRRISLRKEAQRHFSGSVGQQRVPQNFLEEQIIPVPPIEMQLRIIEHLDRVQARVDELRRLQKAAQAELAALLPAVLDKAFRGGL